MGGEIASSGKNGNANAVLASSRIYLNGREIFLTAYNINGNNYFKLRDLAAQVDFGVSRDGAANHRDRSRKAIRRKDAE